MAKAHAPRPPAGRRVSVGSARPPAGVVTGTVLVVLVLLGVVTAGGQPILRHDLGFLRFYGGVFTLVSLTLTVVAGVVATDRVLLPSRHRLWLQSVHRTFGIVAVSCLAVHLVTEMFGGPVGVLGALVPFVAAPVEVGLGTVAAYLMLAVMWSGIVRARFAANGSARLWRPLHAVTYLCWPLALVHGLTAGRPAAVWVIASYLLLAVLTAVALGLRLSAEGARRRRAREARRTTISIAPVGRRPVAAAHARPPRSGRAKPVDARSMAWPYAGGQPAGRFEWGAPPAEQSWRDDPSRQSQPWSTIVDPYPGDDTPTLIDLEAQAAIRRRTGRTARAATGRGATAVPGPESRPGRGHEIRPEPASSDFTHNLADSDYWQVLRGETG